MTDDTLREVIYKALDLARIDTLPNSLGFYARAGLGARHDSEEGIIELLDAATDRVVALSTEGVPVEREATIRECAREVASYCRRMKRAGKEPTFTGAHDAILALLNPSLGGGGSRG